jgi:hypothetical protein
MRLTGQADWVAFIDIDEFLFSSRGYSMPRELAEFGPEWARSRWGTASSALPATPLMNQN